MLQPFCFSKLESSFREVSVTSLQKHGGGWMAAANRIPVETVLLADGNIHEPRCSPVCARQRLVGASRGIGTSRMPPRSLEGSKDI